MPIKLGKDQVFFSLLDRQAQVAVRASEAFLAMAQDLERLPHHSKVLSDIEHEGDNLTHELQNLVAATFITPLDKEDLRDLSQALDDVTDLIEAAAARAELYNLTEPRRDLVPIVALLVKAAQVTASAVAELGNGFQKSETLKEKLKEIHTLENESDRAFRHSLKALFEEPSVDPLYVIKWKEMYDRIETAVDKCEDIAKIIGTVIVKYD
jgi:hypothetical protein